MVDGIVHDIDVCLKHDAPTAAVILMYCAIDAMAFLFMPEEQEEITRKDFIAWVDRYMKTDAGQPYQYDGIDFYGARCGLIHNYGIESRLSRKNECKKLGYIVGDSKHHYKPDVKPDLAILSVECLIHDFYDAAKRFLADIEADDILKRRVDARLPNLFSVRPS